MSIKKTLVLIIIIGIVVAGARCVYQFFYGVPYGASVAVVTTAGDVYFGKATDIGGPYFTLKDVFYPQTFENEFGESEVRLIELGSELHRPETSIRINRDYVMIVQKLQKDSPVTQSIEEYKQTNN